MQSRYAFPTYPLISKPFLRGTANLFDEEILRRFLVFDLERAGKPY